MTRFVHINIISDDWKKLAAFYIDVFGCWPLQPERDLQGAWLDQATSIRGAHLKGIHLALPGYNGHAPTLEIFEYGRNEEQEHPLPNRKGYGHIAFEVDDVELILKKILEHGGSQVGPVVEAAIAQAGRIRFVYARDIDGNIIEIQHWKKDRHA
jgi:catechol 2,3-dioxygenase-like lactoylglutathione lyase family enzyme